MSRDLEKELYNVKSGAKEQSESQLQPCGRRSDFVDEKKCLEDFRVGVRSYRDGSAAEWKCMGGGVREREGQACNYYPFFVAKPNHRIKNLQHYKNFLN